MYYRFVDLLIIAVQRSPQSRDSWEVTLISWSVKSFHLVASTMWHMRKWPSLAWSMSFPWSGTPPHLTSFQVIKCTRSFSQQCNAHAMHVQWPRSVIPFSCSTGRDCTCPNVLVPPFLTPVSASFVRPTPVTCCKSQLIVLLPGVPKNFKTWSSLRKGDTN